MIAKRRMFMLFCLVFLVGCVGVDEIEEKDEIITTEYAIPIEDALDEMYSALNLIHGQTKTTEIKIKNIETLKGSDMFGTTRTANGEDIGDLMYIVNFENDGGSALLSADTRIEDPVIAITEQGSFSATDFFSAKTYYDIDDPEMEDFNLYDAENDDYYVAMVNAEDGFVESIVNSYFEIAVGDLPCVGGGGGSSSTYAAGGPWTDATKIGPMLETLWKQGPPFNNNFPEKRNSDYANGRAPAGCVSVAIGQIMAYHEFPSTIGGGTIDWKAAKKVMSIPHGPYTDYDKSHVAFIMDHVAWGCYAVQTSSWTFALPSNARRYLRDRSYSNTDIVKGYNEAAIVNMLRQDNPVFISAISGWITNGHAWVIDGYLRQERDINIYQRGTDDFIRSNGTVERLLLHCNFGWGSRRGNGYFASGIFDLTSGPIIANEPGDNPDSKDDNFDWHYRTITYNHP